MGATVAGFFSGLLAVFLLAELQRMKGDSDVSLRLNRLRNALTFRRQKAT